jgi:hypothetical protein
VPLRSKPQEQDYGDGKENGQVPVTGEHFIPVTASGLLRLEDEGAWKSLRENRGSYLLLVMKAAQKSWQSSFDRKHQTSNVDRASTSESRVTHCLPLPCVLDKGGSRVKEDC